MLRPEFRVVGHVVDAAADLPEMDRQEGSDAVADAPPEQEDVARRVGEKLGQNVELCLRDHPRHFPHDGRNTRYIFRQELRWPTGLWLDLRSRGERRPSFSSAINWRCRS